MFVWCQFLLIVFGNITALMCPVDDLLGIICSISIDGVYKCCVFRVSFCVTDFVVVVVVVFVVACFVMQRFCIFSFRISTYLTSLL